MMEQDPFARDARNYDISPDGESFVMIRNSGISEAASQRINVVLGWAPDPY